MTLCIAADCEYQGKTAILMCADWRAQTGNLAFSDLMTGSDDLYKLVAIGRATVLLAGIPSKARELVAACRPAIKKWIERLDPEDSDLAIDAFIQDLRGISAKQKNRAIHHYVESTMGVSHEEFLKLPPENHPDVWGHIKNRLNLGADILICAVLNNEAFIVRLDRWGEPHWENNYGIIGNGSEAARTLLCMQMWEPAIYHYSDEHSREHPIPLEEAMFRLTEAHWAAHKANPSSVGGIRTFEVLTSNYRSFPTLAFSQKLDTMVLKKHSVPSIRRSRSSILKKFQDTKTMKEVKGVPPEL